MKKNWGKMGDGEYARLVFFVYVSLKHFDFFI